LPDGSNAEARAINKKGAILGATINARGGIDDLVVWPKSFFSPRKLNDPPSGLAFASAINARNWVVGENTTEEKGQHAILWKGLKSDPTPLRELPNTDFSFARGINDRNEIVGDAGADGRLVGLFWNKKGVPSELPPLEGDEEAIAVAAIGKRGAVGTIGGVGVVGVLWVRERKEDDDGKDR
jgi:uncharacterized membrane protein